MPTFDRHDLDILRTLRKFESGDVAIESDFDSQAVPAMDIAQHLDELSAADIDVRLMKLRGVGLVVGFQYPLAPFVWLWNRSPASALLMGWLDEPVPAYNCTRDGHYFPENSDRCVGCNTVILR